jgi:sacsin
MCLTPEGRQLKLMPWGGAAACLTPLASTPSDVDPKPEVQQEGCSPWSNPEDYQAIETRVASARGRAFCFLPLPTDTGVPIHANGYFELSANRRDIWYGTDMVGAGKLRSEWNRALLCDVVAPSYVQLLLYARGLLEDRIDFFYELWPQQRPAPPWDSLVTTVYQLLLQHPLLRCELPGSEWVSAMVALFPEGGECDLPSALHAMLVRSGLPLVRGVPSGVRDLLRTAAEAAGVELRFASAALVRGWLGRQSDWESELTREEGLLLLRHCLGGLVGEDVRALCGLRLLPLRNGGWGRFEASGEGTPQLLFASGDDSLLASFGDLVVDTDDCDEALTAELVRVAGSGVTNLQLFSAKLLPALLPRLLPAHWRGRQLVQLRRHGDGSSAGGAAKAPTGGPSFEWLLHLWTLLGRDHSQVDLRELEGWPLVPTAREQAYALPVSGLASRMLELSAAPPELASCLERSGCLGLHAEVSRAHPGLAHYVQPLSACAVLGALQAAGGGVGGAVGALLEGASVSERRALRAMLAERRHVEERELQSGQALLPLLASLPIFEFHGGAAAQAAGMV